MPESAFWWDDEPMTRHAFLDEAVAALSDPHIKLTRTHTLVCIDWALREVHAREMAEQQLQSFVQAIARACEIASDAVAPQAQTRTGEHHEHLDQPIELGP